MQPGNGGLDGAPGILHLALEAFEQDQAERIDVTRRAEVFAAGLFRAEVGGGAHHGAGGSQTGPVNDPGDSKVRELGPQRLSGPDRNEQDVGWLDVPVDDAQRMDVGEGIGDPRADDGHLVQGHRAVADPGAQVLAAHQFHGQEGPRLIGNPGVYPGVEQCHEAGMVQGGQQLDLGLLTAQFVRIGRLRREKFQRDVPAQVQVLGRVDRGHAAAADHFTELIAAAQGLGRDAAGRTVHDVPVFHFCAPR